MKNLPKELVEIEKTTGKEAKCDQPIQSVDEIMLIIKDAMIPGEGSKAGGEAAAGGASDLDDIEADMESEVDVSGDFVTAV